MKFANDCALEESDNVMERDTSAFEGVLCDSSLISISDPEMHVVVFLAGYNGKKLRSHCMWNLCCYLGVSRCDDM